MFMSYDLHVYHFTVQTPSDLGTGFYDLSRTYALYCVLSIHGDQFSLFPIETGAVLMLCVAHGGNDLDAMF